MTRPAKPRTGTSRLDDETFHTFYRLNQPTYNPTYKTSTCSLLQRPFFPHCGTQIWEAKQNTSTFGHYQVTSWGDIFYLPRHATHLTVCFLGNAGNPTTTWNDWRRNPYNKPHAGLLVMNFGSNVQHGPTPSEQALAQDVIRAWGYVKILVQRTHPLSVSIAGYSMGNLLALRLTWFLEQKNIPVQRLLLDAPFSTMSEEVQHVLKQYRLSLFHKLLPDAYRWSNIQVASRLRHTPVTQLIRTKDTLVPQVLQEKVWDALTVPKERIERPWSHNLYFEDWLMYV